jgi:hypothetical protein
MRQRRSNQRPNNKLLFDRRLRLGIPALVVVATVAVVGYQYVHQVSASTGTDTGVDYPTPTVTPPGGALVDPGDTSATSGNVLDTSASSSGSHWCNNAGSSGDHRCLDVSLNQGRIQDNDSIVGDVASNAWRFKRVTIGYVSYNPNGGLGNCGSPFYWCNWNIRYQYYPVYHMRLSANTDYCIGSNTNGAGFTYLVLHYCNGRGVDWVQSGNWFINPRSTNATPNGGYRQLMTAHYAEFGEVWLASPQSGGGAGQQKWYNY